MRIASSHLWLRAGRDNPDFKATAARYASGQIAMQVVWGSIVFFATPNTPLWLVLFGVGCAGELVVPWFAEKAKKTQWHRHHVIERFGLLNIIVLGEVLLGSTNALQNTFGNGPIELAPVMLALIGMVITLGMWCLYFTKAEHLNTREFKRFLSGDTDTFSFLLPERRWVPESVYWSIFWVLLRQHRRPMIPVTVLMLTMSRLISTTRGLPCLFR